MFKTNRKQPELDLGDSWLVTSFNLNSHAGFQIHSYICFWFQWWRCLSCSIWRAWGMRNSKSAGRREGDSWLKRKSQSRMSGGHLVLNRPGNRACRFVNNVCCLLRCRNIQTWKSAHLLVHHFQLMPTIFFSIGFWPGDSQWHREHCRYWYFWNQRFCFCVGTKIIFKGWTFLTRGL